MVYLNEVVSVLRALPCKTRSPPDVLLKFKKTTSTQTDAQKITICLSLTSNFFPYKSWWETWNIHFLNFSLIFHKTSYAYYGEISLKQKALALRIVNNARFSNILHLFKDINYYYYFYFTCRYSPNARVNRFVSCTTLLTSRTTEQLTHE